MKHTAKKGYENEFYVWTNAGYKAGFETPVGTVTVNPFVKYRPVQKYTVKAREESTNKVVKTTKETNELRAGLAVGLSVK